MSDEEKLSISNYQKQPLDTKNTAEDLKAYLSIIYGDNIEVIFNNYVFLYNEQTDNQLARVGKLLATNGGKIIKEEIDDIVAILEGDSIIGYAVFLRNELENQYKIEIGKDIKTKIAIITRNGSFKRGKLRARYYNKIHPELLLNCNNKNYVGIFDNAKLDHFSLIGG